MPVPIFAYHSLDQTGSVISVPPSRFRRQMEWLAEHGFTGISLERLLDGWENLRPLPPKPVVLTFDDGFSNLLEEGADKLAELQFQATIFVVADFVGKKNNWPGQPEFVPVFPLLDWTDLKALQQAGFEIGAHGMRHLPLSRVNPSEARAEILDSRQSIEDRLGESVRTFAYPYGALNAASHALVVKTYRGACGVRLDLAGRNEDRHLLSRLDAYYFRNSVIFRTLGTPWVSGYIRLRRAGREIRSVVGRW